MWLLNIFRFITAPIIFWELLNAQIYSLKTFWNPERKYFNHESNILENRFIGTLFFSGSREKLDKREGRCYMEIEERGGQKRCHHEMGTVVSKATCCCSMGKAWGARCESCPKADTEEYKTLCPGGTGYRPNPSTVNNMLCYYFHFKYVLRVELCIVRYYKDRTGLVKLS